MPNPILNQSVRVQQSLEELTRQACQIGEQIRLLEQQTSAYLIQLNQQIDKERHQSLTFEPVYDRDIFSQLNENFRSKFNQTLSRIFLETRLFESRLNLYNSEVTRAHINSGGDSWLIAY